MTGFGNVALGFRNAASGFRNAAGAAAAALLLIFGGSLTALAETADPAVSGVAADVAIAAETADTATATETADTATAAETTDTTTAAGPGGTAAAAGNTGLLTAPAPYSYLTTAYRARLPYAESELDDYGRSLTQVIDRGEYYELTNVNLYAHRKYNAEEVENAAVGDRLNIEGKAYTLKQVMDDGTRILERKNYFETTEIRLIPVNPGRGKTGYYVSVKADTAGGTAGSTYAAGGSTGSTDAAGGSSSNIGAAAGSTGNSGETPGIAEGNPSTEEENPGIAAATATEGVDSADIYYGGSIFIKKDCVMRSLLAGDDGAKKEVTAETYLTVDRKSFSPEELFRYGCDAGEGLVLLRGYFTTDQSGVFITYEEKY